MARGADREGVVLDVRARRGRELEERIGENGDLVPGQRPVDAVQLERLGDVDVLDPRVRVRRADEVEVAHLVPLDVVHEDALPLDEPFVLLARDVLPDEAALLLALFDNEWLRRTDGRRLGHFAAALIASTMLT